MWCLIQLFKSLCYSCCNSNFSIFRVLVGHVDQNPNVVTLNGFGNNGVEELKESLEDDSVMYALGMSCIMCPTVLSYPVSNARKYYLHVKRNVLVSISACEVMCKPYH